MEKSEDTCNKLLLGDIFPDMKVQTTRGIMELPKAFSGKWFVLFSHPADFTPVCTTEFVAFQKRYKEFKELNCELIGLSVNQVFAHIKWEQWIKDNRPLRQRKVSDFSRSIGFVDDDLNPLLVGTMVFATDTLREIVFRSHFVAIAWLFRDLVVHTVSAQWESLYGN